MEPSMTQFRPGRYLFYTRIITLRSLYLNTSVYFEVGTISLLLQGSLKKQENDTFCLNVFKILCEQGHRELKNKY